MASLCRPARNAAHKCVPLLLMLLGVGKWQRWWLASRSCSPGLLRATSASSCPTWLATPTPSAAGAQADPRLPCNRWEEQQLHSREEKGLLCRCTRALVQAGERGCVAGARPPPPPVLHRIHPAASSHPICCFVPPCCPASTAPLLHRCSVVHVLASVVMEVLGRPDEAAAWEAGAGRGGPNSDTTGQASRLTTKAHCITVLQQRILDKNAFTRKDVSAAWRSWWWGEGQQCNRR